MKLSITSSLVSTYADSVLKGISSVEVDSKAIGSGGFGDVYIVKTIDGKRNPNLVLKIFKASKDPIHQGFQTIQKLQNKLSFKHDELKKSGNDLFSLYPSLRGLPLLSFEGLHSRETVFGYIMTDLKSIGFIELSDISSNVSLKKSFLSMSIDKKIKMCIELVSSFKILYDVFFLHADLKEDAFFVTPSTGSIIIIDYDGGVVLSNLGDKPITVGTVQPWSAPEIKANFTNRDKIQVSYFSELWSIAYCIHFIFFTWDPYFFFSEESANSFNEYNARFKWPEVDSGFSKIANYPAEYTSYINYFKNNIPLPIQNKLSQTFSANNINLNRRTGYDEWLSVLSTGIKRPKIIHFDVSSNLISDANGIIASWEVQDAIEIRLDGQIVQAIDKKRFFSGTDHILVLTARGLDGSTASQSHQLNVDKSPPRVISFTSNTPVGGIRSNNPIRFEWDVRGAAEVSINNHIGDVTFLTSVTVKPNVQQLTYELTATSPFGGIAKSALILEVNQSPPGINRFELSPNLVIKSINTPGILVWDVTGAEFVELSEHGKVPPAGSLEVLPRRPKTYTLTARALNGKITTKEVTVEVLQIPPVIKKFTLDRYSISTSTPVLISWEVEEAHQVILRPIGDVTGTTEMYYEVTDDMVFELEAIGYFGGVTKSKRRIIVSKRPPVIRDFKLSKVFINEPEQINLTWNVDGAEKVEIDNGVGIVPKLGNHKLSVNKDTTVSILAISPFGVQAKRKMRITTNKANPIINVTYSPAVRRQQEPVFVKWSTLFAKRLTLDGVGEIPLKGEMTLSNLTAQHLLFTAEGYFGQVTVRNISPLIF